MQPSLARSSASILVATAFVAALAAMPPRAAQAQVTVPTFHGDAMRTGWNAQETTLTPASVASNTFGLLASVVLDDQVDAQPLVVPNETIATGPGKGIHDVVYVATAGNSVYALDAASGAVLLVANFGAPVPQSSLPGQCSNNGPNVGIDSTPVIDVANNVMYAIVDSFESQQAIYRLHEIDLSTLTDRVPPRVIRASHRLSNGQTYKLEPQFSRQRSALLEANGAVYAGFASYCDINADQSRGWLLGWQTGTLAPLRANQLEDRLGAAPDNFFLSSIWMSGFGIAADATGDLFYATGNSDPSTYGGLNIQESVVKEAPALTRVLGIFTPYNVASLDQGDTDFGSGGVLVLPDQPGPLPRLAVAAGKDGRMFLLNRDHLGGYTPGGPDRVVGQVNIGPCWCGESYFVGSDGTARIASSGGSTLMIWKLLTSPKVRLVQESSSQALQNGQDGGFFNTVSSNGTQAATAVVWAAGRPTDSNPAIVRLYAFDATNAATLFTAAAGTWPNVNGNANIMPVVANGKVYVASYKNLSIFGLHSSADRTNRSKP